MTENNLDTEVRPNQSSCGRLVWADLRIQKTIWIRRSDQTSLPQEGQNHQKSSTPSGMYQMQGKETACIFSMEAVSLPCIWYIPDGVLLFWWFWPSCGRLVWSDLRIQIVFCHNDVYLGR